MCEAHVLIEQYKSGGRNRKQIQPGLRRFLGLSVEGLRAVRDGEASSRDLTGNHEEGARDLRGSGRLKDDFGAHDATAGYVVHEIYNGQFRWREVRSEIGQGSGRGGYTSLEAEHFDRARVCYKEADETCCVN